MTPELTHQNPAMERAVLGRMIVDYQTAIWLCDEMEPEDFSCTPHERIFRAILGMVDQGEPVDVLTLHEELKRQGILAQVGGSAYVCDTLPHSADLAQEVTEYHLSELRKLSRARRYVKTFEATFEQLQKTHDPEDVVTLLEDRLMNLRPAQVRREMSFKEARGQIIDSAVSRTKEKQADGIATGWRSLDSLTYGLSDEDLWVLAARPSMGKTGCALSMARDVCRRHTVLIVSLEQSTLAITRRLLSMQSGVPLRTLRLGVLTDAQKAALRTADAYMDNWRLLLYAPPALTVGQLRRHLYVTTQRAPIDLIIVDYLGLVSAPNAGSRYEVVTQVSQGMKAICREFRTPMILLSQLNRAPQQLDDKRPQLHHLRESGAIEQDADVVIFLHREGYYAKPGERPDPKEAQPVELIVAKARDAETGSVHARCILARTWFYEPTEEELLNEERGSRYAA